MLELFCDLTPINTTLSVKKVTTYSGFIAWSENPNLSIVFYWEVFLACPHAIHF